jgi:hypothetical protein
MDVLHQNVLLKVGLDKVNMEKDEVTKVKNDLLHPKKYFRRSASTR